MNEERGTRNEEQPWRRRLLLLVPRSLFLVLLACATTPPPPPAPKWTEVPRGVLDVFCANLRDEGISAETTMDVVKTTQPLITPQSMSGLAEAAFYARSFDPAAMAEAANRQAPPIPVAVPRGPCAWRAVDDNSRLSGDVMTVELSSPFRNPFERKSFGLFARISLARDSANWYWVPLAERGGRWIVGRPTLMGMR